MLLATEAVAASRQALPPQVGEGRHLVLATGKLGRVWGVALGREAALGEQ